MIQISKNMFRSHVIFMFKQLCKRKFSTGSFPYLTNEIFISLLRLLYLGILNVPFLEDMNSQNSKCICSFMKKRINSRYRIYPNVFGNSQLKNISLSFVCSVHSGPGLPKHTFTSTTWVGH